MLSYTKALPFEESWEQRELIIAAKVFIEMVHRVGEGGGGHVFAASYMSLLFTGTGLSEHY